MDNKKTSTTGDKPAKKVIQKDTASIEKTTVKKPRAIKATDGTEVKKPRTIKATDMTEVKKPRTTKKEGQGDELSTLKKISLTALTRAPLSPEELADKIAASLDEKKAMNITIIDIAKKTVIADYFVIASARSTTAVRALAEHVDERLSKGYEIEPLRRDMDLKWCAIDYGSVIMHIFYEETREFYQLERLWADGDNIRHFSSNN